MICSTDVDSAEQNNPWSADLLVTDVINTYALCTVFSDRNYQTLKTVTLWNSSWDLKILSSFECREKAPTPLPGSLSFTYALVLEKLLRSSEFFMKSLYYARVSFLHYPSQITILHYSTIKYFYSFNFL